MIRPPKLPRFPLVEPRAEKPTAAQAPDTQVADAGTFELADRVFSAGELSVATETLVARTTRRRRSCDVYVRCALAVNVSWVVVRVYAVTARGGRALVAHGTLSNALGTLPNDTAIRVCGVSAICETYEVTVAASGGPPTPGLTVTVMASDEAISQYAASYQQMVANTAVRRTLYGGLNDADTVAGKGAKLLHLAAWTTAAAAAPRYVIVRDLATYAGVGGILGAWLVPAPTGQLVLSASDLGAIQFHAGALLEVSSAPTGGVAVNDTSILWGWA